jgi:hypothetical protein
MLIVKINREHNKAVSRRLCCIYRILLFQMAQLKIDDLADRAGPDAAALLRINVFARQSPKKIQPAGDDWRIGLIMPA